MTPSSGAVFGVLLREAMADAVRRRIVPLIAGMALLSLLFIDSCTACSPQITVQGEPRQLDQVAGLLGAAIVVVLGLWTAVLAGVLASDHLAEPLADGSAALALARPVSRGAFALSRLGGALALTLVTGALLLGAAALLLQARQDLELGPALGAFAGCAAGVVTVGALAMAASLYLPRVVTALAVFGLVWGLALVNLLGCGGAQLTGWLWAVDRFGPPLAGVMILPLAPWVDPLTVTGDLVEIGLRSAAWAAGSSGLLVASFRRLELS